MDKRTLLFMLCVGVAFFGVQMFFHQEGTPPKPVTQEMAVQKEAPKALVTQRTSYMTAEGETFYVLENEYQQLVFSSRGGALAEVNLPLVGTSAKSLVK